MKKKSEIKVCTCMSCAFSKLMRRDDNPIISICGVLKERQVARVRRLCVHYQVCKNNKQLSEWEDAK